jgi:hypothetical protein
VDKEKSSEEYLKPQREFYYLAECDSHSNLEIGKVRGDIIVYFMKIFTDLKESSFIMPGIQQSFSDVYVNWKIREITEAQFDAVYKLHVSRV